MPRSVCMIPAMIMPMTTVELLEYELGQSAKQIDACIEGMAEEGFDAKCNPQAMSPREILEHLSEAYVAFAAAMKGEEHEWGSFSIPDKSTANVKSVFRDLRAKAASAALASDDEKTAKAAYDYLIGHDNYHVAQLVLTRLQVEPGWDSYAIYG